MIRISSFLVGLAIVCATSTSHAEINWAAGAPGGTSGTSLDFDNTTAGGGLFLDTGIAAANVGGDRDATTPTVASDYTVSMWINARTLNTATNGGSWFLGTEDQGLHLGVRSTAADPAAVPPVGAVTTPLAQGHWGADSAGDTTVMLNTWHHATFTYDADGGGATTGLQSIYLDGALVGSLANAAPNQSDTNIILGARNNGNNGPQWDGQIDDVALWGDTVLDAAQVADLFDGTQTALALGAQAYYDFEDDVFGDTATVQGTGLGATNLVGITAAVPEPSSLAILMGLGAVGFVRRKRN